MDVRNTPFAAMGNFRQQVLIQSEHLSHQVFVSRGVFSAKNGFRGGGRVWLHVQVGQEFTFESEKAR
jgi:hypothetical protein